MNRRSFLATAASTAALAQSGGSRLPIKKAIVYGSLPGSQKLAPMAAFEMAKAAGFEQIECHTTEDRSREEEMLAASRKTGLPIHSVMNSDHWKYPLNSTDPEVVAKCVHGMETSLRNAKAWGAETVLLVPAVVDKNASYRDAWERSQREIRKLAKLAAETKVIIGVEEVWNHFLLSPLEFARYIDEINSPWVQAYFDVGNIQLFSFPADWIRILGPRIKKLHFKDFSMRRDKETGKTVVSWDMLRDGDIDWKAIYQALADIKYRGTASIEIGMKDEAELKEASRRFDLIVEGA